MKEQATWPAARGFILSSALVLTLGVCPPIAAQTSARPAAVDSPPSAASLSALSLRVKPGDTLAVHLTSGEELVGTFTSASAASLTIAVDGQPREIPADAVQRVVLRRGRSRLGLGLLIGAPIGAYAGSSNCYRVDTSAYQPDAGTPPSCGRSVLAGAAVGAGLGALIGSRFFRPALVFSTSPGATALPVRAADNAPKRVDAGTPVGGLSVLSSRLLPFEKIWVRQMSGAEIVGNFSRASEGSLTIEVDRRTRDIAAIDVQQVWRRGSNRVRQGMWIGFVTGAAALNLIFAGAGKGYVLPATVIGGGAGLMWGTIIGAVVHKRALVYSAGVSTPESGGRDPTR